MLVNELFEDERVLAAKMMQARQTLPTLANGAKHEDPQQFVSLFYYLSSYVWWKKRPIYLVENLAESKK